MDLRRRIIRLAHENKELRPLLLPVLKKYGRLPPAGLNVPKDVYLRAGRRWLDALERKGFMGAIRATEIRIDKIKPGSPKALGIAEYLRAYMRDEGSGLKAAEKTALKGLISKAKAKAKMASLEKEGGLQGDLSRMSPNLDVYASDDGDEICIEVGGIGTGIQLWADKGKKAHGTRFLSKLASEVKRAQDKLKKL